MARRRPKTPPVDYVQRTRELPVNLLFLMPWLVVYELCLLASASPVENAAAAWLKDLGQTLGREGLLAVTLLTCLLFCVVLLRRVGQAPGDQGVYGGMLVEGLVYGALLGVVSKALASTLPLGRMVPLAADGSGLPALREWVETLGLAVGAGVFEEVAFRGLLLAGLLALLVHGVGADRATGGVLAVLASAWVFSSYHHWGLGGEPWHPAVFAFRFWAGVALGALYLGRGLGIAAFAHGFYDTLVMLG
jgi:membrane protease YdiL (CAAX protease family)